MKKYVVKITVVDVAYNSMRTGKTFETYDEMEAFSVAAEFVKWAKEYIDYWYCVDFNDEADYILSIATKNDEEKTENEEAEEEDFDDFEEEDFDDLIISMNLK